LKIKIKNTMVGVLKCCSFHFKGNIIMQFSGNLFQSKEQNVKMKINPSMETQILTVLPGPEEAPQQT
jgi:hypothetical protein